MLRRHTNIGKCRQTSCIAGLAEQHSLLALGPLPGRRPRRLFIAHVRHHVLGGKLCSPAGLVATMKRAPEVIIRRLFLAHVRHHVPGGVSCTTAGLVRPLH